MQNDYRWYDSRQLIYLFGVQAIGSPISNRPRASAIALKSRNSRGDLSTDRNSHSCIYQIHCRVPVYLRLSLLTRPHSHFRLISLSLMQNTIAKRYSIYIYIYIYIYIVVSAVRERADCDYWFPMVHASSRPSRLLFPSYRLRCVVHRYCMYILCVLWSISKRDCELRTLMSFGQLPGSHTAADSECFYRDNVNHLYCRGNYRKQCREYKTYSVCDPPCAFAKLTEKSRQSFIRLLWKEVKSEFNDNINNCI